MAKTNVNINENGRIKITNVTLSFPNLFTPTAFQEGQTPKFSASFIFPKEGNEKVYEALRGRVDELMKENKITKDLPDDNVFLIDGDETDREEYAGHWIIKAKNAKRPAVFDRQKDPVIESDGIIYGGCIVNGVIDTYYFKHASGKKFILATLKGVQWVEEGTPFGDSPISSDEFDDLDDL